MKRQTYLYATLLALLLLLLRAIEYKYLIYELPLEYYVGILAVFFTALGVWTGRKLTSKVASSNSNILSPPSGIAMAGAPELSPRERQVLELIAKGHSNQEIADALFLSLNTIKKHTSTLFTKLEVKRRTQAIERAKQFGILA